MNLCTDVSFDLGRRGSRPGCMVEQWHGQRTGTAACTCTPTRRPRWSTPKATLILERQPTTSSASGCWNKTSTRTVSFRSSQRCRRLRIIKAPMTPIRPRTMPKHPSSAPETATPSRFVAAPTIVIPSQTRRQRTRETQEGPTPTQGAGPLVLPLVSRARDRRTLVIACDPPARRIEPPFRPRAHVVAVRALYLDLDHPHAAADAVTGSVQLAVACDENVDAGRARAVRTTRLTGQR